MDEIEIRKRVRVGEPATELLDDVHRDVDRERDLFLRTPIPHGAKVAAFHEVHGEEQLAAHQTSVKHGNQIPVRQLHHNFRLIAESRDVLRISEMRKHGLDDHHPL